jgi:hypothetical protein
MAWMVEAALVGSIKPSHLAQLFVVVVVFHSVVPLMYNLDSVGGRHKKAALNGRQAALVACLVTLPGCFAT